jgi:DNA-binding beta-propeller fold protein YncE
MRMSRLQDVKVADPTSVVMIVNRDSNDLAFMDIKTKKIVGKTFLGNNVNPHMVMMSPDGRYVVTGGTRANKAYIVDARTLELVKVIPVGIAPEHLSFSPDSRWYYQGNPDGDSISVIDMQSMTMVKTINGLVEPLNITFTPDGSKAYVGNYGAHWVGVIDAGVMNWQKNLSLGFSRRCQTGSGALSQRNQGHQCGVVLE